MVPPVYLLLVEGEEQATPLVPVFVIVAAERESAAVQLRDANEHAEQVAQVTERFEMAIG